MKYLYLSFFSLLLFLTAGGLQAQQGGGAKLTGQLLLGDSVFSGGYVYVTRIGTPNIPLAYAVSGADGLFSLTLPQGADSLLLVARNMSTEDGMQPIANRAQHVVMHLKPREREIEEVRVGTTDMVARADTTAYLVQAFAQLQDHSVGDVISRMPGFFVRADGRIAYQGTQISHYYIDDVELLGQNYGLANANIPYRDVASVEVMHNHQDKKVLQGKEKGRGTAINVKLRRGVSVTGSIEVGGGYKPWMWLLDAVPMFFTKGFHVMGAVQANNVGINLVDDARAVTYADGVISGWHNNRPSLVSAGEPSLPGLPGKRV